MHRTRMSEKKIEKLYFLYENKKMLPHAHTSQYHNYIYLFLVITSPEQEPIHI